MEDLNKIFNYEGKIYTLEEAKQEIFDFIDLQAEILREDLEIFQNKNNLKKFL